MRLRHLLFLGVVMIGGLGTWMSLLGQAPPPPGGGNNANVPCRFDCYDIVWMGGYQNGVKYCWNFEILTGRLVWSPALVIDGGMPVQDTGCSQVVYKYWFCPQDCSMQDETPQTVDPSLDMVIRGTLGFGCWECSGD